MNKKKYILDLSFDDGYKLDLRIADLLEKHNLTGIFYIVLD